MTFEEKQEWAKQALRLKAKEKGNLPLKEDFDEAVRSRIKAFLGPWPRALEAAGLKEPRPAEKKKRKRSESRKKKIASLKAPEGKKHSQEQIK